MAEPHSKIGETNIWHYISNYYTRSYSMALQYGFPNPRQNSEYGKDYLLEARLDLIRKESVSIHHRLLGHHSTLSGHHLHDQDSAGQVWGGVQPRSHIHNVG